MLQSSSHYLRPDYLAAPITTLDNKSSPLALLAQTCSAIGADTTNPKLLAANIEKSTKSLKSTQSTETRDKSSPVSSHSSSVSTGSVEQQPMNNSGSACAGNGNGSGSGNTGKATFKPYESNNNHIRERLDLSCGSELAATNLTNSQRSKTPKGNGIGIGSNQTNGQRCDSNQSASSQRESPAMAATAATNGLRRTPSAQMMAAGALDLQQRGMNSSPLLRVSSKESAMGGGSGGGGMPTATIATPSPSSNSRQQAVSDAALAAAAKEASYVKALHAAAAAAGVPSTNAGGAVASPYYSGYPSATAGGMPYPMDLMAASALMSPHHPMFKAAAMNPYLNYARLKGLDGSTAAAMMSPNVCRDPYCTGCPSSPHYLNKAAGQPCPAGCPQCELASGKVNGAMGSNASGSSSAAAAAAAAASSYHAQLAALAAASQLPYVCSWIGSDAAYCGKRFGTSDELFQHLRTHTASVPDSVLSAAAAGGIPPNHPLFQRTYPTPPLSPLSAARYHPYGKPSMLPPSLAPPGMPGLPPHPALAQYFSPYSLYGPRMGSSHP